jgi:hypothetical protein
MGGRHHDLDVTKDSALAKFYGMAIDKLMRGDTEEGPRAIPPIATREEHLGDRHHGKPWADSHPQGRMRQVRSRERRQIGRIERLVGIALLPAEFFESRMKEYLDSSLEKELQDGWVLSF